MNPAFADINDDIEMVRSLVRVERKATRRGKHGASARGESGLLAVYNEYEAERTKLNDRKVKLITDYAAAYPDLSDARAQTLLDDWFAFEGDTLELRQKYARRLAKSWRPRAWLGSFRSRTSSMRC